MNLLCCLRPPPTHSPPVSRSLGPTLHRSATLLPAVHPHDDAPEEPDALCLRPQRQEPEHEMGHHSDTAPARKSKAAGERPSSSPKKKKFKAPLYVAPQSLDSAQPLQATDLQKMALQLEDACKPTGRIAPSTLIEFGKNLEMKLSKTLPEDRLGIVLNFMTACRKADVQNPDLRRRTWTLVQGCMNDLARHSTQKMEPFFHSPEALAFALDGTGEGANAVEKQLIKQQAFLWAQKYMHAPPRRSDRLYPTIKNIYQCTGPCLTNVQQTQLKAIPTPTCVRAMRYALADKIPGPLISSCLRDLVQAWPAGMRAVHQAASRLDPAATEQWLDSAPALRLALNELIAPQPK